MIFHGYGHGKASSMVKFYQTRDFKELENEWNQTLAQSGFDDAEKSKNGERVLKQAAANVYQKADAETIEARAIYFSKISYHLCRTEFQDQIEKFVMMFLADGKTIKQTVVELFILGYPTHRHTVRFIIRRWEHEWGIRYWSEFQRWPKRKYKNV